MADNRLTDQLVADLLAVLRSDASLDSKLQHVTAIKSGIKQHNVPETCLPHLFDALRTASTAQHAALASAGFTALNHLFTRLSRQEPKFLAKEVPRSLPLVVEKLGDQKDKLRSLASQSLTTLYHVSPADVERALRNSAMAGKNPRAKEAAMKWLVQTHNQDGLQFRSYVPLLMELLEDADGMVRDTAKSTVIELFSNAPNAAKSDLKRQLKSFKVRPAIEQAIVKSLTPPSATCTDTPLDAPLPHPRSNLAASVSSISSSSERPVTPMFDLPSEAVDPLYVNSQRELDDIFRDMAPHFDGKETEQNWMKREQSIGTLRKLNAGNSPSDFPDAFLAGIRTMLDGIIKATNSLRTSLSKEGCALIQDIAITWGPAMDPMVELLMQTLLKLSAGTKKISSHLANTTVDTLISRVSYTTRLMQHIWGACQDKNVQPRSYVTGWLKTLLKKEARHKNHVEHTGGLDLMEKCIRKGLGDPNPGVREKMRSTYWAFWAVWPARADAIMADLDATAQKLLNKDPNNPNSPKKPDPPRAGLSRSAMGTASKPSLRETMMAQKKATLGAKHNLPARPGSAMAHISPVRTVSSTSSNPAGGSTRQKNAGAGIGRGRPEATVSVNAGGMSVAPMRPARRRPEVAARPATAGPYSVREASGHGETESPDNAKAKSTTLRAQESSSPRRGGTRPQVGHAPHASESSALASALVEARPNPATISGGGDSVASSNKTAAMPSSPGSHARPSGPPTLPPSHIPSPTFKTRSPQTNGSSRPQDSVQTEGVRRAVSPPGGLKVYEDPFTDKPALVPSQQGLSVPVLEDKPVNEDAAKVGLAKSHEGPGSTPPPMESPEKARQNSRLLDSGINKIQARSLEVHGFRKLQSLIRDSAGTTGLNDERLEALLLGLFGYLEDPLPSLAWEKAQDVKAQVLATIKLLLTRKREAFDRHVSRGVESLLRARSGYEARAHVVSGLELLADDLVTIGDGAETVEVLAERLRASTDTTPEGCRTLSMGFHVLKELLQKRASFSPSADQLSRLAELAVGGLESADSGVRMDAVQFCVALHERLGEAAFWAALGADMGDDPKSLITYYIVKRQRERQQQQQQQQQADGAASVVAA